MPEFADLPREIVHRTQVHPGHPPVVVPVWNDHAEQVTDRMPLEQSHASAIRFAAPRQAIMLPEMEAALAAAGQEIRPGDCTVIGFPLKIRGGTASPIRAVAMFG